MWRLATRSPRSLAARLSLSPSLATARLLSNSNVSGARIAPDIREGLFSYTSGRWLYNEHEQNRCRYAKFDIEALADIAEQSVDATCVGLTKLNEGSYNKAFLLDFANSAQLIVRIPCPVAGPSYLTTASEVATLEFAREVLKLPVPRVLTWSDARKYPENTVGVDYIMMEVVPGTPLGRRWMDMKGREEVTPVMEGLVALDATCESLKFSQYGSLYFKEDVSLELQVRPLFAPGVDPAIERLSDKYRVGPLIDRHWWRGERAAMDLDRGPWSDATSYFLAAARNERKFLLKHADTSRFRRGPFHSLDVHLRLLDMYEAAIPHVLPRDDDLSAPTLKHADISLANVFIAESGPSNITGIIDWQHTCILPYFCQINVPEAVQYHGELIDMLPGFPVPAPLPHNLADFTPEKQEQYRLEHRAATRQKYYELQVLDSRRRHATHSYPCVGELIMLPTHVARAWADNVLQLRQALVVLRARWDEVAPGTPCPIVFTAAELAEHAQQWERFREYERASALIEASLGFLPDGWIMEDEQYDSAKKALAELEGQWSEQRLGSRFPYRDGEWAFFLS